MAVSAAGRKKFAAFGVLVVVDGAVLALSICVHRFTKFYDVTDMFPLVLSGVTLVVLLLSLLLDLVLQNAWSARPWFEIPFFAFFSFVWIGLNVFSTVQWSSVPLTCSSMQDNGDGMGTRTWCREFLALRIMIWVFCAALLAVTLFLLHVVSSRARGDGAGSQAWNTSIARYEPEAKFGFNMESVGNGTSDSAFRRASSLSNILLFGSSAKSVTTVATHDYFAPLPLHRDSYASSYFNEGAVAGRVASPQTPSFSYLVHYRQDHLRDFGDVVNTDR